jgi:hypothetical protein
MGFSLRNITKKVWDQINPLDNGRTYQNSRGNARPGHAAPSAFQQYAGAVNRTAHVAGRAIAATTPLDEFAHGTGHIMQNLSRQINEVPASSPARFLNNAVIRPFKTTEGNAGQILQGHNPYHGTFGQQAGQFGQDALNVASVLPIGKGANIALKGTASLGTRVAQGAKLGLKAGAGFGAGQGVATSLQNKYNLPQTLKTAGMSAGVGAGLGIGLGVAGPVVGAGARAGVGKIHPPVTIKPPKNIPVVDKSGPGVTTKYIAVKQSNTPSPTELVNRYNQHMANLSKKFSQNQKQVTLAGKPGRQAIIAEPSIYNDVGYQAEKQQIQKAYENGTLSKPIPVTEGKPVVTKKVATTPDTKAMKAQLKTLQAQPKLNTQGQIKEALLKEKLGQGPEPNLTGLGPTDPNTITPKAPGAADRAWMSVRGVISRHGTGGMEVARRLGLKREASELGQEHFIRQIPTVRALKSNEFKQFVSVLERRSNGENVSGPPVIAEAIKEWNKAIPTIRDRAVKAGLDVGDLGPNYFPRQYKDLFKGDGAMRGYAQQMVNSGKAKTVGEAMDKLRFMRQEYSRPFGNLEKTREIDLPGYEKTPEALTNYISRSFERISHAEQFGGKNQVMDQLKSRMAQEGYDISPGSTLDKHLKIAFNDVDKQSTLHKVSGGIRTVNAYRSLGGAGIANATQLPVNTATIAGIGRTVKGVAKLAISPKARDEARATGVLLDHSISDLAQSQLGVRGKVASNIASPLFRNIERFNRQATAIVGKDFGNAMARKAAKGNPTAIRMLEKIGVRGDIGSKLTREQEVQAARGLVEAAQFKVDPMDLPGWVDSPAGKLVAQFRTFQYKQTDFMYNYVLKEATKGNFLPLTRFLATGATAGTAALAARGVLKGNNQLDTSGDGTPEQKGLGIAGKALSQVGGPGLVGGSVLNLMDSAKYGNLTAGIAGVAGGPTASGLVETTQNLDKGIGSRHNWDPLMKEGLRQLPTAGPYLSNKAFPKKDQPGQVTAKPGQPLSLDDLNAKAKQETKDFKTNMKTDDARLAKLSNGKYIYQVGNQVHTVDSLKKAREALAKDAFGKSGAPDKVVGDKYYYRNENDEVKSMPKYKHEYDVVDSQTGLDMDVAKDAGDYKGWTDSANKKLKALETLRDHYNKDSQADKVDDTEKKIFDLKKQMKKFASYGGSFDKPKKGRSGGSGGSRTKSAGSAYEYAVSPNAGKAAAGRTPKVALRRSGGKRGSVYRSSKPKVSLKKSRI